MIGGNVTFKSQIILKIEPTVVIVLIWAFGLVSSDHIVDDKTTRRIIWLRLIRVTFNEEQVATDAV